MFQAAEAVINFHGQELGYGMQSHDGILVGILTAHAIDPGQQAFIDEPYFGVMVLQLFEVKWHPGIVFIFKILSQ